MVPVCLGARTRLAPVRRIMTLPTFVFVAVTTAGGSRQRKKPVWGLSDLFSLSNHEVA
jgi:hypothetical protein